MIHISVRNLVEFLLRCGNIEEGKGVDTLSAMQAGSRLHRKLQKQAGSDYHAEVPLKFVVTFEKFELGLEGRADGIIFDEKDGAISYATIDEIKGVYNDVAKMEEPEVVHLAQAKCYAYIFATQQKLEKITVRMTYANLETEEIKRFTKDYTYEEIEDWFCELMEMYRPWGEFSVDWAKIRNESIEEINFPFEYRPGQKNVVASVYHSINERMPLFIQAPTGTGKTISTLYPAIKAVGEGKAERIFYLTAKTVTRTVASDTIELLEEKGYKSKTVEICAKDKMCPLDKRACNPIECNLAKGHYDRINDALYQMLTSKNHFYRDEIIEFALEKEVCPFEFCLDLSSFSDNILCDYNYVFDPNVCLKRFFREGTNPQAIVLVDESHNLVDRGREMYSQNLIKEDFLAMKRIFKNLSSNVTKHLEQCNKKLLSIKRNCDEMLYLEMEDIESFYYSLFNLSVAMNTFFEKKIPYPNKDEVLTFYFDVKNFLNLLERYDEHFVLYCDFNSNNEFVLHLFCVDPSNCLQEKIDMTVTSVFFSATFLPLNYYKELLCNVTSPYATYAQSAFSKEQRLLLVAEDISSRYQERNNNTYKKYAQYITNIVMQKTGNYIAFFPSYQFMEKVYEAYNDISESNATVIVQKNNLTEGERDEFLNYFSTERDNSLIAFCIQGGIFSEGIDLTGESLIGCIICGLGLPQVNNQQKVISNHFDKTGRGFEFAYQNPGMNKVLQAAGRLIRTKDDYGVIALLDHRFLQKQYQQSMPNDYLDYTKCNVDNAKNYVKDYWDSF